jgi:acrylyl-CoA reductase (NADPH)
VRAILVTRDGGYHAELADVGEAELPEGDVTVCIEYTTLNYKDSLAITGASPVVRSFPMIPGIDFAGIVEASSSGDYSPGDRVVLNGWGVGELHWGGFAEKARVRSEWLVPLPAGLTTRQAMAIGTAGYTAMLCALRLEQLGVGPDAGEVLVTGAAGGVGSIAVSLLAGRGYRVVASTGRPEQAGYLERLGAAEVVDRSQLSKPGRPMGKERWAGVVDAVGSHTLANACATTRRDGVVTSCGLAQGADLPLTVLPFILRGVTLAGVDSVYSSRSRRLEAWGRLAEELDPAHLDLVTSEVGLEEVIPAAPEQLAGRTRGRVVINLSR